MMGLTGSFLGPTWPKSALLWQCIMILHSTR